MPDDTRLNGSSTNPPTEQTDPGRGANGRFAKHNAGGPGNPFARQVAALRQVAVDAVTADDIRTILLKMVEKAKAGDVGAARLVLAYAVGKPVPAPDPDTLDRHELEVFRQLTAPEGAARILDGMPLEAALPVFRTARPHIGAALSKQLAAMLREPLPAEAPSANGNDGVLREIYQNVYGPDVPAEVLAGLPSTNGPNGGRRAADDRRRR